jgi:uncharacterized membrane protein
MPSIAAFHPNIVHFAIGLLVAGVVFRLGSLTGRLAWTGPAATALIACGTAATVAAVVSGDQAHGPVERVPGARAAVVDHEEWGIRTRNVFLGVTVIELIALGLAAANSRFARHVTIAAAVAGVAGLIVLYEAAEHGGELVYGYAGGVGIRSGDPADVNRLLIAGVYHQANQDRQAGHGDASTALVEATARRFPDNLELQLFAAEWQTDVRKAPAAALQRLDALAVAQAEPRLRVRAGLLRANALAAQGNVEGAKAVLQTLKSENPTNQQIQRRLEELSR